MTQIRTPELVNTKAETLFRQQVRGGIQVANQAHPYLATRGFYGSIDTITQMNIPDLAKATAALLLAIPNLARMVASNGGDVSICSTMHTAMGTLMDSSYQTSITKNNVLSMCMDFNKQQNICTGEAIKNLEEQLLADLAGVWHEHSWENLLIAADINVERANRGEDLAGTDLWLQLPDAQKWVSVDIKARPETILRHAHKKGYEITDDYTFDAHGVTAQDFELYIAASTEHRTAYLSFNNPPGSDGLAPIDFRGNHNAIVASSDIFATLQYYEDRGLIKPYRQLETTDGTHYVPFDRRIN